MRLALGASGSRLARQLLTESLVLALPAACAGLLLASWLVRAMVAIAPPDLPRVQNVTVDGRIVLFTAAIAIVCAVLFGLTPMMQAARVQSASSLRRGRGVTPAAETMRVVLIVGEMALALVLLVGAGLLLRTYARLTNVDPGFTSSGVASIEVGLQSPRYFSDWNRIVAFYDEALPAVASVPGVRAAAVTNLAPFDEGHFDDVVAPAARPDERRRAEYRFVSPGYFSTLSIPLLSGRDFSSGDRPGADRVAILAASTAVRLFGDRDPVGQVIVLRKTRRVVVGTVGDTHLLGLRTSPPLQVYMPFAQADEVFWTGLQFLMRTDRDPLSVAKSARERLLSIDRSVPPFNVRTIDSLISRSLAPAWTYASMLTAFALVALLLACAGLYGLISYFVAQRTQEFGVRLALGADAADLRALVLRDAAKLVSAALVIGGASALVGSRALTTLLFGITPRDWPTFVGVSLLLSAVAFAASYVPARRAMDVDPLTALRAE